MFVIFWVQKDFYTSILEDLKPHSYFIVFNAKIDNSVKLIAVENDDFWYYVITKEGISKSDYVDTMKPILEGKTPFLFKTDPGKTLNYQIVNTHSKIDSLLQVGPKALVNSFFNKFGVARGDIEDDIKPYLIAELFERKIACKIDDETGLLFIQDLKE